MAGPFADLITQNEVGRVTLAFEDVIAASFVDDPTRMTMSEVKRRFNLCAKIFQSLRGDLKWGIQRSLSALPTYLRCELDGTKWEPSSKSFWAE